MKGMKMQAPRKVLLLAAQLALLLGVAEGVTIRGVVTGDVGHMPWRKGKEELGWCSVKLFREGRLEAIARTNSGKGGFEIRTLRSGRVQLTVSRPGFKTFWKTLTLAEADPPQLQIRLKHDPSYESIVLPRTGTAVTSIPGGSFTIEFIAGPTAADWKAALRNELGERPLEVAKAEFGERAVWNGTRAGWRLTVRVADDMPADLHDLYVFCVERKGVVHPSQQAKAVRIRPEYPARFRLMPYLDFHFNWLVNKRGAEGEVQKDFFKAASLLNPLFVSLGDDIGFETDDAVAMFHHLVTNYCDVPVYLAFGNHDAGIGVEGYEYYFGPRWQTRRMGPHVGLIISYDLYQANYQIPEEQQKFVNAALAKFHADPEVKLIFLAGHTHSWKPRKDFFTMPFTAAERLAFPGHTDGGKTVEAERLFLHSLSVSSMHGWAGLHYTGRVMELEGFRKSAAKVKAALLPQAALPSVEFEKPNNGTAKTNTATIRLVGLKGTWTPPEKLYTGGYFSKPPKKWRGLPGIRGARLRFVMPQGRYKCSRGRILRQVDGAGGRTTLVAVSVDATEPVTEVTLTPQ